MLHQRLIKLFMLGIFGWLVLYLDSIELKFLVIDHRALGCGRSTPLTNLGSAWSGNLASAWSGNLGSARGGNLGSARGGPLKNQRSAQDVKLIPGAIDDGCGAEFPGDQALDLSGGAGLGSSGRNLEALPV